LRNAFRDNAYGVRAAAEGVHAALAPIHKRVRIGNPYLAREERWDYQNTITILAPLDPDSPAAVAWRSSIYTETVPLNVSWTPAPTMTVQVTASFAYVRDGSWDEFLAGWYNAPLAPTVGEWCPYIPPALVDGAEIEPLSLTVAQTGGPALRLDWSETAQPNAAVYWLYEWNPTTVSWVARQLLPIEQTSSVIMHRLPAERYRFMVVAQNVAGEVVAQSNELEWRSPGIYLPLF
jgi:hypothetical protein